MTSTPDGGQQVVGAGKLDRVSVIGKGGELLKEIGTAARLDLKRHFGRPVHHELWVKVREGWSDDEKALRKFGFET